MLFVAACASPPPPAPVVKANPGNAFSAENAWRHLVALSELGPRVSGTEGSVKARAYLVEQLESYGLEVESHGVAVSVDSKEVTLANLAVTIPGSSPDLFLFSTHYDTAPSEEFPLIGANEGASGTAVLLELARVYAKKPMHYTVQLSFIDGDVLRDDAKSISDLLPGSVAWINTLEEAEKLKQVRFALVIDQVGDRDLAFSRDLHSHRIYREIFWKEAGRLGYQKAFSPTAKFEPIVMSHRLLDGFGVRSVVGLADMQYGEGDPPGAYWRSAGDTPENNSQESLEVVGRVTLLAVESISKKLQRVDQLMSKRHRVVPPVTSAPSKKDVEDVEAEPVEEAGTAEPVEKVEPVVEDTPEEAEPVVEETPKEAPQGTSEPMEAAPLAEPAAAPVPVASEAVDEPLEPMLEPTNKTPIDESNWESSSDEDWEAAVMESEGPT